MSPSATFPYTTAVNEVSSPKSPDKVALVVVVGVVVVVVVVDDDVVVVVVVVVVVFVCPCNTGDHACIFWSQQFWRWNTVCPIMFVLALLHL
jgi:hypothetical protein